MGGFSKLNGMTPKLKRLLWVLAGTVLLAAALQIVPDLWNRYTYPEFDIEFEPAMRLPAGEVQERNLTEYPIGPEEFEYYASHVPENVTDSAPIVIYCHGAMADEKQGMEKLDVLREEHLWKGDFIYISILDYEFTWLRKHLTQKYGERTYFLIGGSRGGAIAFRQLIKDPGVYSGAILLCPAIGKTAARAAPKFGIPLFIVVGDRDGSITESCYALRDQLEKNQEKFELRVIPDGDHNAPFADNGASWAADAMALVFGESQ